MTDERYDADELARIFGAQAGEETATARDAEESGAVPGEVPNAETWPAWADATEDLSLVTDPAPTDAGDAMPAWALEDDNGDLPARAGGDSAPQDEGTHPDGVDEALGAKPPEDDLDAWLRDVEEDELDAAGPTHAAPAFNAFADLEEELGGAEDPVTPKEVADTFGISDDALTGPEEEPVVAVTDSGKKRNVTATVAVAALVLAVAGAALLGFWKGPHLAQSLKAAFQGLGVRQAVPAMEGQTPVPAVPTAVPPTPVPTATTEADAAVSTYNASLLQVTGPASMDATLPTVLEFKVSMPRGNDEVVATMRCDDCLWPNGEAPEVLQLSSGGVLVVRSLALPHSEKVRYTLLVNEVECAGWDVVAGSGGDHVDLKCVPLSAN